MQKRDGLDAERVVAWRQHRLIFQADTLEDIAAEFNRYNRTPQILIEGESIRRLRFTGTFDAHDPDSLAIVLDRDPELTVNKGVNEWVITRR